MWILKIQPLDYMVFIFLTYMSNFIQIGCYLLFDQKTYFWCIIFTTKNLKFKHIIDDIAINVWSYWNFASMKEYNKNMQSNNYFSFVNLIKQACEALLFSSNLLTWNKSIQILKKNIYKFQFFYQIKRKPDRPFY